MSIQTLIDCMNELNEVHQVLLELAGRKRQVLIHNQVDLLNQIVNQENKLLRRITALDQQRVEAIGTVLMQRGYRPDPQITVSDLIRLIFRAEDKQALMDSHKRLLATLDQLREQNALNQQLIESSLAYINFSIELTMGTTEQENTYQHPMKSMYPNTGNSMFNSKA
jgi:flagellar biosynthesis/type III secretory pathway chaperone